MNIGIFIDFDTEDNVILTFDLPLDFMNINDELYLELTTQPFYIEKNLKLNSTKISNEINKLINIIKNNFIDRNQSIDNYNFSYYLDDQFTDENKIIEFIKLNKDFNIELNTKKYEYLIKNFKPNDISNFKIKFKNNNESISYEEFYSMYKFLSEIINFVKKYNLSPLEQVMLVYDIVKSNEYIKENEDQNKRLSRDLSKIISSGKIVCEGYSNLLNFIFDQLNIKNKKIYLEYTNKNVGHARNMIYLEDEKYNINGYFIMDATFDSKNKKRNNNYLNNYYYFLKPLNFFNRISNEEIYKPDILELLKKSDEEIKKHLESLNISEKISIILKLNTLLNKENITNNIDIANSKNYNDGMLKLIQDIKKIFNKNIPEIAFKNALYKIRKIEYINNILKNNFTEQDIDEVCNIFYKETPEIRLMKVIGIYEEPTLEKSIEESNAKSSEEDLLRIRFLKAIKTRIQDFPENELIKKM